MGRALSVVAAALVVSASVWGYLWAQNRAGSTRYRTVRVERGPLATAVSASGNLNAVTNVLVGSQVSGQIKAIFVDFNSPVRRGQVIARIDPAIFEAKVSQARAELDAARATVLNQQAQVERARAELENARAAHAEARAQVAKAQVGVLNARRDLDRKSQLYGRELIAKSERDSAQATHDAAAAQLESAQAKDQALAAGIQAANAQLRVTEATLVSARAQVRQRQAALEQAEVDLDHTTIRAPVDGVVVSRAVDVGQTVAASLQAPILFTIAQDLTKMQVETSVDEADIGRISADQRATFTVDAFPGETFDGHVAQIRKAPQVVQNVVTYTVVVAVDNPGGRLLPGMTANVKLVVARKANVLTVPNAALRFRPPGVEADLPAPAAPGGSAGGGRPSIEQIRERLVKELGLSEEQQRKLEPILEEGRQQLMALRELPEGERQARAARAREATRVRIREILTPEQRARYDESGGAAGGRAGGGGRVWVLDGAGSPRPVALGLGISDGSATEVVRGELSEGQEVIVGLAGSAGRPGGASGGPRLRF